MGPTFDLQNKALLLSPSLTRALVGLRQHASTIGCAPCPARRYHAWHATCVADAQVVDAVQSSDAASDKDILERCTHAAPRHKPGRYCMLPGRLFPARPSALAFAVRLSTAARAVQRTGQHARK